MVDNRATRNHISLVTVKWLGLPHRQKENPYPLVTISGDPIIYKDKMIYLKTGPIRLKFKGKHVNISFNMLLLKKDETVLGMLFL